MVSRTASRGPCTCSLLAPSRSPHVTTRSIVAVPLPGVFLGNACVHAPRVSHIAIVINSTVVLWNCVLTSLAVGVGLIGGTRSAWLRQPALRDFFTVFLLFAVLYGSLAFAAAGMPCA